MKQIALDTDMTVSALIRSWLQEYQKEAEKKNGQACSQNLQGL